MKAVILMGGTGSRLAPLNKTCNKHLINVGGKPMSQHSVEKLVNIGITNILIVTGKEHMGSIVNYYGSGLEFGCTFTYKVQEEAGGIAQAIRLVDGFVDDGEKFIVILGDNVFYDDLQDFKEKLYNNNLVLTTTTSKHPERFGVIQDGTIIEKPNNPKTDQIITGIYGYTFDSDFKQILNSLDKSDRGEVEVTDLNNGLMERSSYEIYKLSGWWTDAGCHDTLKLANDLIYG